MVLQVNDCHSDVSPVNNSDSDSERSKSIVDLGPSEIQIFSNFFSSITARPIEDMEEWK